MKQNIFSYNLEEEGKLDKTYYKEKRNINVPERKVKAEKRKEEIESD